MIILRHETSRLFLEVIVVTRDKKATCIYRAARRTAGHASTYVIAALSTKDHNMEYSTSTSSDSYY
mgnify:CR=1 FL=1